MSMMKKTPPAASLAYVERVFRYLASLRYFFDKLDKLLAFESKAVEYRKKKNRKLYISCLQIYVVRRAYHNTVRKFGTLRQYAIFSKSKEKNQWGCHTKPFGTRVARYGLFIVGLWNYSSQYCIGTLTSRIINELIVSIDYLILTHYPLVYYKGDYIKGAFRCHLFS